MVDTLKLSPEQRKLLEETGSYEPPKPPPTPLHPVAVRILHAMVRDRVFGEGGRATIRDRLLVWSSFSAIKWSVWSWKNYGYPRV